MNVEVEDKYKLAQLELNRVMDKLKISEEQNRSNTEKVEALELEVAEMKKLKNDSEIRLESARTELNRLSEIVKNYESKDSKTEQMLKSRDQEVVALIKKVCIVCASLH